MGPPSEYRFDDESFDAIAEAGVDVARVLGALHGGLPKVRKHIGSEGLHIYASAPDGRWLAMAFVETTSDDVWLLTRVRVLAEEEAAYIRRAIEGGA